MLNKLGDKLSLLRREIGDVKGIFPLYPEYRVGGYPKDLRQLDDILRRGNGQTRLPRVHAHAGYV